MHFANCFDFLFAFPLEAFEAYLVFISSLTAGIRVEISWKRGRRNNFINTGSDRHHHQLSYSHWICLVWARHFFSYNFAYLSRKVIFQILHRELWFLQVRSKNLRMVERHSQKGWRWRLIVFVFTNMTVRRSTQLLPLHTDYWVLTYKKVYCQARLSPGGDSS